MSEKAKRVMDETKLKQLSLAREKANAVRKAGKELKDKERAIKVIEHETRVKDVDTKLKELGPKPKKQPKIVYVEESSSEDEPEVVYVKRKKSKEHEHLQPSHFQIPVPLFCL